MYRISKAVNTSIEEKTAVEWLHRLFLKEDKGNEQLHKSIDTPIKEGEFVIRRQDAITQRTMKTHST